MATTDESQNLCAATVAVITLPQFWIESPALWLTQVEAKFAISRITANTTKYFYLVEALPPQVALQVADVLNGPTSSASYDALRNAILTRLEPSSSSRLQRFLQPEAMGDRTPSQYLRYLLHLLGDKAASTDPDIIKEVFLSRLPKNVRFGLAASLDSSVETLATIADRMMAVPALDLGASFTRACPSWKDDREAELYHLREEIAHLRRELAQKTSQTLDHSPTNHPQPDLSSGGSQLPPSDLSHTTPKTSLCFYHQRFGITARHCNQPCSWHSENHQARR